MSSRPQTAKEIFLASLDLAPSERSAFLREACGNDEALRREIEALLNAAEHTDSLLDQERIAIAMDSDQPALAATQVNDCSEGVGSRIGPYKLLQQIGEGGMGSVFMAEQTEPVTRRVALKIIKPGMDSRQVIARFEAERQAIALMDHPNIARVFDAGTTSAGRPYFVMELVNGIPITEYCDQQRLTPRQRLELFVPICQAVQHAHQKGIIHRDLKPSNILVAQYDDRPVPKVIDFGVAKATSQKLTERTLFTQFGQIIGTLEYMSPEQAKRNQLDVDTRSDIYSLGVVLYELLTGATPFDRKRMREAAYEEILRIIREEDPPTPSVRLSSIETLPSVAVNRHTEPARLRKTLKGELDWIVMKALEKDRTRRYETANGFGADLQRYLSDEPVVACPPSATYRIKKFACRNRMLIASLASIASVLLVATGISLWMAIRAITAEKSQRTIAIEKQQLAESERESKIQAEKNAQEAIVQRDRAQANAAEAHHNQYIAHMQQVRHEWHANDVGRVKEILDQYRTPATGQIDERGWEWYYWDRMCHLDLRTLAGHTKGVNGVAFSPDSSLVASASSDETIKVWETASGKLVRTLEGHGSIVTSLAFHPDGKRIGAGDANKSAIIWEWESGKQLYKLDHRAGVNCVAFSPDGKLFATGSLAAAGDVKERGQRKIWNADDGDLLQTFSHPTGVLSIAFTRDNSRIVCAGQPKTEMWELANGKLTFLAEHESLRDNNIEYEAVTAAVLSPDEGTLITGSRDRSIKSWDVESRKEIKSMASHVEAVTCVAYHPSEKRVASSSEDRSIRVWDAEKGSEELVLRGHSGAVRHIAYSSDGMRLASASTDGTIKIWDANQQTDIRFLMGSSGTHLESLKFRPNGNELALSRFTPGAGENGQWVEIHDAAAHAPVRQFRGGHKSSILSIALSKTGKLLATGGGGTVQIWDTASGNVLIRLSGASFRGLFFSPDGSLLAVGCLKMDAEKKRLIPTYRIYDSFTGEMLHEHPEAQGGITFSCDGKTLAIAKENEIEFLNPRSGSKIRSLPLNNCTSIQFGPRDNLLAARVSTKDLRIWDSVSGKELLEIKNVGAFIGFDATGRRLFSVNSRNSLNVWDSQSGDLTCVIKLPLKSVNSSVAISADNNLVAIQNLPFAFILDIRQSANLVDVQRESQALAAELLKYPFDDVNVLIHQKQEVLTHLKDLRSISEAVRLETERLVSDCLSPMFESIEKALLAHQLLEGNDVIKTRRLGVGKGRPTPEQRVLALKLAKTAYEIHRNWVSSLVYGWALCENENYAESIQYLRPDFEDSLSNEIDRTMMQAVLARSQFHLGDVEKAKAILASVRASPFSSVPDCALQIRLASQLIDGLDFEDDGAQRDKKDESTKARSTDTSKQPPN